MRWGDPAVQRLRLFATAAVLLVLLAGCAGKGGAPRDHPWGIHETAAPALFDEATGAVTGRVLSVESQPVAGADVLLLPGSHRTPTALDGSFSFSFVAPGAAVLHVARIGFEAERLDLEIVPGHVLDVGALNLIEVVPPNPRKETTGPSDGYIQCRWAGLGSGPCGWVGVCEAGQCVDTSPLSDALAEHVWPDEAVAMNFTLTGDDWREIVLEAKWEPSTVATNTDMAILFSYDGRPATHLFSRSEPGESPHRFVYQRGAENPGARGGDPREPTKNHTLTAWLAVGTSLSAEDPHPLAVAYEMRFQLMATVFYSSQAPEKYTAFPDA